MKIHKFNTRITRGPFANEVSLLKNVCACVQFPEPWLNHGASHCIAFNIALIALSVMHNFNKEIDRKNLVNVLFYLKFYVGGLCTPLMEPKTEKIYLKSVGKTLKSTSTATFSAAQNQGRTQD